jgi:putative (di)nucleoside polyphosphate hydrolase
MTRDMTPNLHEAADNDSRPYRHGVGLMVLNREGRVFVGNRIDYPGDNWQMPQGGIDPGETPYTTAMREFEEEIGTSKAEIIAESRVWHCYDLPSTMSQQAWNGQFRGQKLRWFALRFTGTDQDIRLDAHEAEFNAWRWVAVDELPTLIVPFKRAMYEQLVNEFGAIAST